MINILYKTKFVVLCIAMLSLTGCGSKFFNGGYDTTFTECPRGETGECMSVEEAHERAIRSERKKHATSKDEYVEYTRSAGISNNSIYTNDDYEEYFNGQKPLDVLLSELESCTRSKDKDCIEAKKTAIKAINIMSEDRALARKRFEDDLMSQQTKMAALQREAFATETMPVRTTDKLMELTLLPYQTETGALASARKFWFVIEEGSWAWDTQTATPKTQFVGSIQ